ncbi:TIGR02466 family protein [Candidatus Pelagibacter bacterium nBUS_44]|uniref:TIGR02466 family protein n=1 Tax=Candidatus Pelagibacter bacterium nBUS_44 TaxID=3374195 RepID=UPI003EBF2AEC
MEYIIINLTKKLTNIFKIALNQLKIIYFYVLIKILPIKLNNCDKIKVGDFFLQQNILDLAIIAFKNIQPETPEFAKKNFYLGSYIFEKTGENPKDYFNKFFISNSKKKLDKLDYYPPKLLIFKFENRLNLDNEINEYIETNKTNSYSDKKQINIYRYYQSEHNIFNLETFNILKLQIEDFIKKNKTSFFIGNSNINFHIKKMWFVKSSKGVDLKSHYHPEGILSGIYYYDVPNGNDTGDLIIQNPRDNIIINDQDNLKNFNYVKNTIILKPIKNSIVLFNSYLKHSVRNKTTTEDRISIPFDLNFN